VLFNSISFLFIFLPISLIGFFLLGRFSRRAAAAWLCLSSFVFYSWLELRFVIILIVSILFNYAIGYLLRRNSGNARVSGALLVFGVGSDLLALFYYKYALDLMHWAGQFGVLHGVAWGSAILPLGISFFTFTQIGFLVDSQAGVAKENGFLEYVLFVTFFPHLIAGPILHHREIMPQFKGAATYSFDSRNFFVGISMFIVGLGKKVLIADQFIPFANGAFASAEDLSRAAAWCGVLAYFFQLYFDFAGYSEMALGLARMFNIRFSANFDSPYKATNIIDFWQRWHISLTRYLTLYIYNPIALEISRRRLARGLPVNASAHKTPQGFAEIVAFPTIVTMTLAGVWHGSGLQFLIFGVLHGFYLTIAHAWRLRFPEKKRDPKAPPAPRWQAIWQTSWKVLITCLAVIVAQVFFRAPTVSRALTILKDMSFAPGQGAGYSDNLGIVDFFLHAGDWLHIGRLVNYLAAAHAGNFFSIFAAFIIVWCLPNVLQIFAAEGPSLTKTRSKAAFLRVQWRPTIVWGILLGLLAALSLLALTGTSEFLYFRF
jgi:alginate O-acetyltransferase complex protein AlgI